MVFGLALRINCQPVELDIVVMFTKGLLWWVLMVLRWQCQQVVGPVSNKSDTIPLSYVAYQNTACVGPFLAIIGFDCLHAGVMVFITDCLTFIRVVTANCHFRIILVLVLWFFGACFGIQWHVNQFWVIENVFLFGSWCLVRCWFLVLLGGSGSPSSMYASPVWIQLLGPFGELPEVLGIPHKQVTCFLKSAKSELQNFNLFLWKFYLYIFLITVI